MLKMATRLVVKLVVDAVFKRMGSHKKIQIDCLKLGQKDQFARLLFGFCFETPTYTSWLHSLQTPCLYC